MLDPAGDAQYPGRIIDDSFERGITLQCVEELQRAITRQFPHVRVVLTRFPGETCQPLQNAHFANRLDVDLYRAFTVIKNRNQNRNFISIIFPIMMLLSHNHLPMHYIPMIKLI